MDHGNSDWFNSYEILKFSHAIYMVFQTMLVIKLRVLVMAMGETHNTLHTGN